MSKTGNKLIKAMESVAVITRTERRADAISFVSIGFRVCFVDGGALTVPFEWYPRLKNATEKQLANYQIVADGKSIYWPDLNETISVESLLYGPTTYSATNV